MKKNEDQECSGLKSRRLLPGCDYLLIGSNIEPYTPDHLDRASGGFHTLCADVGIIPGHPLSGYVAGDILPMSVWNQYHRPDCIDRRGFVYDPGSDVWVQIYLPTQDAIHVCNNNDKTIHVSDHLSILNLSYNDFLIYGQQRGWRLLTSDEFSTAAEGSNEMTNISGSERPNKSGGHFDQCGRRMISNIGCEDCCGVMWQYLSTPHPVDPDSLLFAGAMWNYGTTSGSRSRYAIDVRTITASYLSARFGSEPHHKRVATAR